MESTPRCPSCSDNPSVERVDGQWVCQSCSKVVVQVSFFGGSNASEHVEHEKVVISETQEFEDEPAAEEEQEAPEPFVSKLPGKFLADDPDFIDRSLAARSTEKVLLPDGAGGVTSVHRNVVKIQHKGKTIELVALPAEEKQRRQFWINLISIGLGILIIVLFFWFIY